MLARLAWALVTRILTLMTQAIQQFSAPLLAAELGAMSILTSDTLLILTTMAADGHFDAAGRAATRMEEQVTRRVRAVLVLLALTVLAARVRQGHWRVGRLLVSTTEALVARQYVLCVAVVAVRTGPRVESAHHLGGASLLSLLAVVSGLLDGLILRNLLFLIALVRIRLTHGCKRS